MSKWKQRFDYDCGHMCLRYLGFTPPKLHEELAVWHILRAVRGHVKEEGCDDGVRDISPKGFYLLFNRRDVGHWVAGTGKGVYDPLTGKVCSVFDFWLNHPYQDVVHYVRI